MQNQKNPLPIAAVAYLVRTGLVLWMLLNGIHQYTLDEYILTVSFLILDSTVDLSVILPLMHKIRLYSLNKIQKLRQCLSGIDIEIRINVHVKLVD